jgi:alcohol dehydrogenase class IV
VHSPRLSAAKLPQFVVPTTPTTAIVKAGSAVFDPASGRRFALFDPKTRAQAVFIHPDFVASAPRRLVTTASINTLTLAVEGLTSRTGEPLADALLMHALRLVKAQLGAISDAVEPRVELVLAAILCGQGTDHSGMGATTVLSHAIGARHDLENGALNAVLLPHVLRFNAEAAALGMAKVAAALDMPGAGTDATIAGVEALLRGLGVPASLRETGVPRDDLPAIAALGMQDWFLGGNPRRISDAAELLGLLELAWP